MSSSDQPNSLTLKWVLGALALLGLFLLGLDQALLFDVDEGAFTEATREMLVSGDWSHTTLNGQDRFDKPIGVYWLQAISASIFGLNEFAFRLPSALSAISKISGEPSMVVDFFPIMGSTPLNFNTL